MDKAVENSRQMLFGAAHLPAHSPFRLHRQTAEHTELEGIPVGLVEGDLCGDLFFLHREKVLQIQFIPQQPEEGHVPPGGKGRGAEGLGVGRSGNVSAHYRLGIEIGKAPLNIQPFNRVGIVRTPHLGREGHHPQIKPVPAGGTALQQNMGSGLKDAAEHLIQPYYIIIGLFSQGTGVAVHVPLYIGDIRRVQDG